MPWAMLWRALTWYFRPSPLNANEPAPPLTLEQRHAHAMAELARVEADIRTARLRAGNVAPSGRK